MLDAMIILDRRNNAPLRTSFTGMPALNVAGKDDRGILTQNFTQMNMTYAQ